MAKAAEAAAPTFASTPAERVKAGRAARRRLSRSGQAAVVESGRDPLGVLRAQDVGRVPELLPLRYGRMAASPFAFFRGAAAVMAADLARGQRTGLSAQLCGDAHLSNFGLFASPERQLVFDINDFDETLAGPWEWDVKRLAASIEVACRDNGLRRRDRRSAVLAMLAEYRRAMNVFAGWTNLQVWHAYLPAERSLSTVRAALDDRTSRLAMSVVRKAKTRDHLRASGRLVEHVDGTLRFTSEPPLLVPLRLLLGADQAAVTLARIEHAMGEYSASLSADRRHLLGQYRLVDVARKVVGVGSVGTRAWVVLMVGRDDADPMIMQIKEAGHSVLEAHLEPSHYENAGQRVVAGQRTMQAASDILLGWQRFAGFDEVPRDFYVRQLHDWKGSVEVEQMGTATLTRYAQLCAWTLARAHARSGDRIAIAAYLGRSDRFDEAVADSAVSFADLNERDHAELVAAIAAGTIVATTDG